jgi:hypothetical protein
MTVEHEGDIRIQEFMRAIPGGNWQSAVDLTTTHGAIGIVDLVQFQIRREWITAREAAQLMVVVPVEPDYGLSEVPTA